MNKMCFLFTFAFLLGIIEILYFYPQLPDYIAVHFNITGSADRWGSKEHFFWTMEIVFVLLVVLFGAMPLLIRLLPVSLISLPDKDYWFAPIRKEQTINRLVNRLLLLGFMVLLFMDGIFYLSIKANLTDRPALPPDLLWSMIVIFLTFTIVWTISLIKSFRQP
ncbi:MAG TPA: DUF1648 domain-containing protein [Nitrospirota bacterium]|nr:DUF1648 domain-containing protein [Nitrospirota bacterium]